MMTTSRVLTLLIASGGPCLFAQQTELRTLANGLAQDIAAAGKKSVAVVDFTDLQGNPTELGRFLAEEFSVALTRSRKGFEVIDRAHLKAVLAENKLASSGLIDPATAKKLGQIVGADALLTGTMTPFSESVRVAVKVLATDTARILAADTTDLPKTATITELLGARTQTDNSQASRTDAGTAKGSSAGVIVEEFQYELLGCKGIGGTVECSLRITNRGSDRTLYHTCGSGSQNSTRVMAYDNLGNVSSKAAAPLRIERVRTLFMLRLSRAFPPARPSRFQI